MRGQVRGDRVLHAKANNFLCRDELDYSLVDSLLSFKFYLKFNVSFRISFSLSTRCNVTRCLHSTASWKLQSTVCCDTWVVAWLAVVDD